MVATMDAQTPSSPSPSASNDSAKAFKIQSPQSSSSSSSSAVNLRLWRPAAQRNLRNQWSKLASLRHDWASFSSTARSHATSVVNSFLSQKYMDAMELGALSDMPAIRKKACLKLLKQQVLQRNKLLSSYKDMVGIVIHMVKACRSMRFYTKGTSNSPLVQFSCFSESQDDTGDGEGNAVFTFWSIPHFEKVAGDFVQMIISELSLKRLLVMEFLSLDDDKGSETNRLHWSDEFYPREFEDLSACNLYTKEACEPVLPSLGKCKSETAIKQPRRHQDHDVLQVYLTTWIAEVNIDRSRVDEIFAVVGAEMHVTFT